MHSHNPHVCKIFKLPKWSFLLPLIVGVLVAVLKIESVQSQSMFSRQEQLQAAFFHKFTGFIEWEPQMIKTDPKMHLCVIGESPLAEILETLAGTSSASVDVVRVTDPVSARTCSLIYISTSMQSNLHEIFESLEGSGVVTVSDIPNFIDQGGMIQFIKVGPHVRFIINESAAKKEGIKLSSQLLALANRAK